MTTSFVFSGGGSLGAVQVGMLQALFDHGITPDRVYGSSVGAINAAWIAGNPTPEGAATLARIWRSIEREQVFPARPLVGLTGVVGRRNHLISHRPLRELIAENLTYQRIEDAKIDLTIVATELTTGLEVPLTRGAIVEAALASAAIPGVFEPVAIDGRYLIDGGVANNTPISLANRFDVDHIVVLPTGYPCALAVPPRSALGVALQSLSILLHERLLQDVAHFEGHAALMVLPPLCPLDVSPMDFSHTPSLIDRSYAQSAAWLQEDHNGDPRNWLAFHRH